MIEADWSIKNKKELSSYTQHSNFVAIWNCSKGHEYSMSIKLRRKGYGCPYCAGKRPIHGETDLATIRPDIAAEWDYENNPVAISPADVLPKSNKVYAWICRDCKQGFKASPAVRINRGGHSCPYCSGKRVIKGKTDLATLYPDMAAEWDYKSNALLPDNIAPHSNRKFNWICRNCGEKFSATPKDRIRTTHYCPFCAGKRIIPGVNDLLSQDPGIASEWSKRNGFSPDTVHVHSSKRAIWQCSQGHEWNAVIRSRTGKRRHGCPYCAGKKPVTGINDLRTKKPFLSQEYSDDNYIPISEITLNSNRKVEWICRFCGFTWRTPVIVRVRGGRCPNCKGVI